MSDQNDAYGFLAGGGEMGALMRAYDWQGSALGAPDGWPQSLRLAIRLMLHSRQPMFIWWGPDLIQFYNDAYRETMGPAMHPAALGAKGRECWADIWSIIGPQIDYVMSGRGSTWQDDQLVPINRHGQPESVWWTYGYSPIDFEGAVGGVLVVCSDVSDKHRYTQELQSRTERLGQLFEQAPGFIAILRGPNHVFELTNASYRKLTGRDEASLIGKPVRDAVPDAGGQGFFELLDQVYQTGEPFVGRRVPIELQPDEKTEAEMFFLDFIYQAIRESDGTISGIFVEGQDVSDHVLAEERLTLINGELQHRVKNTLAMVQAIANQTLKPVTDREPVETFEKRLFALSRAHDTLVQENWSQADIRIATSSSLSAFGVADRVAVKGPSVELGPNAILSLSMILHELTTNAVKYGALAVERGHVSITWDVVDKEDGPFLQFVWQEREGPAVVKPEHRGFGSKLISRGIDGTGEVALDYAPSGFAAHFTAPLSALTRV